MATEVETKNIETKAFVVHAANEDFTLEDVTLDQMQDHELLIEMLYSGICATDLGFQAGKIPLCPFPCILGHEGAGIVRAIGSKVDRDFKIGDKVLLSINYCKECKFCKAGHPADCIHGTRLHLFGVRPDGTTAAKLKGTDTDVRFHFFGQSSFAKWSFVQEMCAVKVPEGVKDEDLPYLAAMGCGYQTGAGTVENILKPEPDSSIVVFGLGTVGLTAVMAAKYMGVKRIIGVDIFDHKFDLAKEVGCTDTVNSKGIENLAEHLKKMTDGAGVDYAVDCTGVLPVIEAMLNSLAMRGTAAIVGVPPSGKSINIDPMQFLLGSRGVKGCREGDSNPPEYVPHLCELQRDGKFPVEKLCKVYEAKDIKVALQELQEGKVTKPVLKW